MISPPSASVVSVQGVVGVGRCGFREYGSYELWRIRCGKQAGVGLVVQMEANVGVEIGLASVWWKPKNQNIVS